MSEFQPDNQFRLVEQFLAARFTERYVTGFGDKTLREENTGMARESVHGL